MAEPTPQQLAKALTLDERMAKFGFDPSLNRGTLLPFGTNQQGENEWAVPQIGYDMVKALVLPGHVAQGGQVTNNDVTEMALNLAGMGGSSSMALGKAAVGGPGGKVLGANVAADAERATLPTDTASRMARAKKMGFNVDAYHATVRDFGAFDNAKIGSHLDTGYYGTGHYTAPSPLNKRGEPEGPLTNYISNSYNEEGPQYFLGANIMPLKLKMNNPLIIDKADIPNGVLTNKVEAATGFKSTFGWPLGESERAAFMAAVKDAGFDGVRVDYLGKPIEYVTPDPKNIRSRFAQFDPAKADSADLLAMTGNPAMLAAGQNQNRPGSSEMALELAKRLSDQDFYAKGGI